MKKLLLVIALLPLLLYGSQSKVPVKIDPRVELCSIAFRLAGAKEYSSNVNATYIKDIEEHFNAYENDTLIRYVKYLRDRTFIGYDAVMTIAVSLQGKNGKYTLPTHEKAIEILYDNSGRWNKWNAPEFIRLLNEFYEKSDFETFFRSHKKYYDSLVEKFNKEVNLDANWFPDFYGTHTEDKYHVIIAPSCGNSNYGPHTYSENGGKNIYAVLGVFNFEEDGSPTFSYKREIVVHEMNHSYINPLTETTHIADHIKDSGDKIMAVVGEDMKMQAYADFKTVINESLVRAAVIRYMKDHCLPVEDIKTEIISQKNLSYYWIEGLDSLYEEYDNHRDIYPDMQSFYPHIENYFKKVAQDINKMKDDFYANSPYVASVTPLIDGKRDVSPSIKSIEVKVSCPVKKEAGAVWLLVKEGGEDAFSSVTIKNEDTVVFYLNLSPNTKYHFIIRSFVPATDEGYFIKPCEIRFKTGK